MAYYFFNTCAFPKTSQRIGRTLDRRGGGSTQRSQRIPHQEKVRGLFRGGRRTNIDKLQVTELQVSRENSAFTWVYL